MKIYAHRGASTETAENSLAAFALALELGAEGIELDVHLCADGQPVVIHDAHLDRTTSGTGRVSQTTSEQLRALDAGDGRGVPTLGEVVELVGGRALLDIEIKAPGAESATLNALAPLGFDRWAISSFDWDILRRVRSMSARAELWPLSQVASDEVVAVAHEIQAPLLALNHKAIDASIAEYVHAKGLGFMAWTVNEPSRALELEHLGAAAVCTDDPRSLLASRGRE